MEKGFLLSVIVPVYNVAPYLRKCLDSIVRQTYQNFEIILVDDGSKDNSIEICKDYAAKDKRIKLLCRSHEGVTCARKAGVMAASGEYVAWVDSDDQIEKDAYEKLIASMENHRPDILIHGFIQEYLDKAYICQCGIPNGYYDIAGIKSEVYPYLLKIQYTNQVKILSTQQPDLDIKSRPSIRRRQQVIYPCVGSYIIKRELLKKTQLMVPDCVSYGEDLVCIIYNMLQANSVMVTDCAPYRYQKRENSLSMIISSFQPYQVMFDAAYDALRDSPMRELHINQLCEVMLDYVLLMRYEAFLRDEFSDLPFGNLTGHRVALYGAGKFGQEIYRKTSEVFPDRIVVWVDQNDRECQKAGLPVKPVEALLTHEYDLIVIAVQDTAVCEEIKQDLTAMGIDSGVIRYVNVSKKLVEATKKILMEHGNNSLSKTETEL